jgi:hypothetical protein
MKARRHAMHLVVIGLLAAEILALAVAPAPRRDDRSPIAAALPATVGDLTGKDVWFCHSETCVPDSFMEDAIPESGRCPSCGGPLHTRSTGEELLLPEDTVILRKLYAAPGRGSFQVTAVVSGRDRQSFHRPQYCLPGQGHTIIREEEMQVSLADNRPLRVMFLDLKRTDPDGVTLGRSYYAYWYATPGRETPSQLERLFWTAWDTLVGNTRTRWAYVALYTGSAGERAADVRRMQQFIAALYPRLQP